MPFNEYLLPSAQTMGMASRLHPNSLVDPTVHSPALLELIDIQVSRPIIEYLVDSVVETVDYVLGRPAPSSSRGYKSGRRPEHAKFASFVKKIIERAEVSIPTVLVTLVYIDRAKPHLCIALEEWALERVFLGALIVASKYLHDSTLKNVHWALCTGIFGKRDVGRIEREYLEVLDFELAITEADLLSHHQGLLNAVYPTANPNHSQQQSHITNSGSASTKGRTTESSPSSAPVPVLSLSSDESSSGSASPRTPTDSPPPAYTLEPKKNTPRSKKSYFPSSALDLLRSFHIPLPEPAYPRQDRSHTRVR